LCTTKKESGPKSSGFQILSKIDDLLSQELASKIMGSDLRDSGSEVGLELRGNTAAITAILLLTKTRLRFEQSEILVASSWDNKSSSFLLRF
jgi:hypothetical protein